MTVAFIVIVGVATLFCVSNANPINAQTSGVLSEPPLPKWNAFQKSKYYFSSSAVNQMQADGYCKSMGSSIELASIHSKDENNFLFSTASKSSKKIDRLNHWIGGVRNLNGNKMFPYSWSWTDGSKMDILDLYAGCKYGKTCLWNLIRGKEAGLNPMEPNNFYGNEYCLATEKFKKMSNAATWRDEPCSALYHFICKLSCPAFSGPKDGQNITSGCSCNLGYQPKDGMAITVNDQKPFVEGSCTPVPCPANSYGVNLPSGCTCNAGYSGSITASLDAPSYYTGSCTPVSCPANTNGENLPAGCATNAGYSGSVTKAVGAPFYTGTVTPVDCPSNSLGQNVPSGCTCNAGFAGIIAASTIAPFYTGSCAPVNCPAYTNGANLPAGCATNAGYSGSVTKAVGAPYYTGTVTPVNCPIYSFGPNVPGGCTCNAGYSGTIAASTNAPLYYTGSCSPVNCPANTNGANLPAGCATNAGFSGSVTKAVGAPFYTGTVTPVECPAKSNGPNVPGGCTCNAGYSGTIAASTIAPFYTGSCNPVECPANSNGANVPGGCTCNAGYSGAIVASTIAPFFTGSCVPTPCPENSAGTIVALGCTCNAGFSGDITSSQTAPYYSGSCEPVPCPMSTNGDFVAGPGERCTCTSGYSGAITPLSAFPYYSSTCMPVPCPAGSIPLRANSPDIPTGCYCNYLQGLYGDLTPTTVAPYYAVDCQKAFSCKDVYTLSNYKATYGQQRIIANANSWFQVRCDGDFTLVASRVSGSILFKEGSGGNLDPQAKVPGRVPNIWSADNDQFTFRKIRFTYPITIGNPAPISSAVVFPRFATVTLPNATTLAKLNALPFSGTPLGTTEASVPNLKYFYWKALAQDNVRAQILFTNNINVGDSVDFDMGGSYWVASGTRINNEIPTTFPQESSDNTCGAVDVPIPCKFSATCGGLSYPTIVMNNYPNTLIWLSQ